MMPMMENVPAEQLNREKALLHIKLTEQEYET